MNRGPLPLKQSPTVQNGPMAAQSKNVHFDKRRTNEFQQFRSALPGWIFQGRPARYCRPCFVHGVRSVLQCFVLLSINCSFVFPLCSLFCLVSSLFLLVCWFVFPCFVYGLGLAVHCFVYGFGLAFHGDVYCFGSVFHCFVLFFIGSAIVLA